MGTMGIKGNMGIFRICSIIEFFMFHSPLELRDFAGREKYFTFKKFINRNESLLNVR
jgi:hypothetical protein